MVRGSEGSEKKSFLVALDYGKGGVWAYLRASSATEIAQRYPALSIVSEPPPWLDETRQRKLEERMTVDIDDAGHSFLLAAASEASPR
jgi:hypothetical protein